MLFSLEKHRLKIVSFVDNENGHFATVRTMQQVSENRTLDESNSLNETISKQLRTSKFRRKRTGGKPPLNTNQQNILYQNNYHCNDLEKYGKNRK